MPESITFQFNTGTVLPKLALLKAALRKHIGRTAMLAALEPILQEAKQRCPRDTGALRQGILKAARAYGSGARILGLVGPSRGRNKIRPGRTWRWLGPVRVSRYAHLVENGAPHHAAQPFLRPAFQHGVPRFPFDFGRNMESLINAVIP